MEELMDLVGEMILLEYKGENTFSLRGQFEYLEESNQIYFVGSPWFNSMDEVKAKGLTLRDFAIHDPVIDLLHVLGNQRIANDEIKELLTTVQKQKNTLSGINQLVSNLLTKNTLQEIAWEIIDNAISRFGLEDCVVYILDDKGTHLLQIAAWGEKQGGEREVLDPIKIKVGDGIVGKVALSGKARLIGDTSKEEDYLVDDKFRYSELTVPIIAEEKVIGVIDSEHSEKNFFTRRHLSDFKTIASLTAIKIKNAQAQAKKEEAEKELRENRKKYQQIIENAGDMIYEINPKGFYTYANPVFLKKAGYTYEELSQKHFLELVAPEYQKEIEEFYEHQALHQIVETYKEFPAVAKSGELVWIGQRATFTYHEDGTRKKITGVARDISDKKRAEIALQKSVEKYRGIIANMELGLIEVDLNDRIVFSNQSFCKMSGYSEEELLGQKASDLLLDQESKEIIAQKSELRAQNISDAYEMLVKTKHGEKKWWLISGAPHFNERGEMVGSIGIHLDISKQKNLEVALKLARDEAEENSKSKEYFLANMSHEIRTPLNAMIGMVRELKRSGLNPAQGSFAKNADVAAKHLLSIINNILDLSKIKAGELHLNETHFSMHQVVKETIGILSSKAKEKDLDLSFQIADDVADVYIGDPLRIRQVLINLIGNSIKFTERGLVRLRCKTTQWKDNQACVHIHLMDTGIGMDSDFLENIFEKFTQEDKTSSRKYEGTGLGMTITYELIQLMQGEIQLTSEKGRGTDMDIYLPLPLGDVRKLEKEEEALDYTLLQGKRVLLVEDNEMNRLVATNTLSNFGVLTDEAENGLEAIKQLKKDSYDFILMDIQMPLMDGISATKVLRNDLKIQTPIIALTANAFKRQIDQCLEAGMDSYITKPFEEKIFLETIIKVLQSDPVKMETTTHSKAGEPQEKTYDLDPLTKLSNGNQDFVHKMIHLFIDTVPTSIGQMKAAFEAGNYSDLSSIAHRIKPSVRHMGIDLISEDVKSIEVLAIEDPQSAQLPLLLNKVEQVLLKSIEGLKTEL